MEYQKRDWYIGIEADRPELAAGVEHRLQQLMGTTRSFRVE
jgi:hypothetical protein